MQSLMQMKRDLTADGQRRVQGKSMLYALAVSAGLMPLEHSAIAAPTASSMGVSTTVVANAKLQMEFKPDWLNISLADVRQGYVDVSAVSRFSVHTNSRSGYRVAFFPVGNLFTSVQIGGFRGAVLLGADGGEVVHRGPAVPGFVHALSFRFALSSVTQAGIYPWPLQMAVRAL